MRGMILEKNEIGVQIDDIFLMCELELMQSGDGRKILTLKAYHMSFIQTEITDKVLADPKLYFELLTQMVMEMKEALRPK